MKRCYIFILCIVAVMFLFAAVSANADAQQPKKATVIVYMCGADLESENGQGTGDISDIRKSGYNRDNINVIILQGGATHWQRSEELDISKLHVGEPGTRRPTELDQWDYSPMSDPDTLTRFLDYTRERYPAERYYLVIWDHGGGPNGGVCQDHLTPDLDTLSVNELVSALENSSFREDGFEIICFNTCLTGSIEYAYTLSPYARYMVATEDSMFGLGYGWIKDLDSEKDTLEIASEMVKETFAFNEEQYAAHNATEINCVAVVDLSKTTRVVQAMDRFFAKITPDMMKTGFVTMSDQRRDTATFGIGESGGASNRDLADLGDLVVHLREFAPEEADELLDALTDAVVYKETALDSCYGLTVYHPYINKTYMKSFMEVHNGIPLSDNYSAYIQQFAAFLMDTPLADWTGLTADAVVSKANRSLFSLTLTEQQAENLAEAELYMLARQEDGSFRFACVVPDVTPDGQILTGEYMGTALYAVSDGQPVSPALPYEIADNGIWLIPARLTMNGKSFDALIRCAFNPDDETLTPGGMLIRDPDSGLYAGGYTTLFTDCEQIEMTLVSRKETRDENGVLLRFEDWDTAAEEVWEKPIDGSWQFALLHDKIDLETLYAAFQVRDAQANYYTSEMVVAKGGIIGVGDMIVSYDDLELLQINSVNTTIISNNLLVSVAVTNLGDVETDVELGSLTLNGTASDKTQKVFGTGANDGLAPGETQTITVMEPVSILAGADLLTEMTFTLKITEAGAGTELGEIPVSVSLSLNLRQ